MGDVTTLGADLTEPREEVVSAADAVDSAKNDLATAQQELVDAQAALAAAIATASSAPNSTFTPATSTTTTLMPPAMIERVQQAEDDLSRVSLGITDETPLVEAAADYNSAALALQIARLRLLDDAQCLTDEQHANAVEQITAYTTALQTDLLTAGYDPGPIDGMRPTRPTMRSTAPDRVDDRRPHLPVLVPGPLSRSDRRTSPGEMTGCRGRSGRWMPTVRSSSGTARCVALRISSSRVRKS